MPLPTPVPGLVICYEFLWKHERAEGAEHGRKKRPCAIIVAVRNESSRIMTIVAPVTHVEPRNPEDGVEIPRRVKQHLGLDQERSWISVTDLNRFLWPGYDLYPIPGSKDRFDYGMLPPRLFDEIKRRILARDAALKATPRD